MSSHLSTAEDADAKEAPAPVAAHNPSAVAARRRSSYFAEQDTGCSVSWSRGILRFVHEPITNALLRVTRVAVTFPKITVSSITVFSLIVIAIGLATNFSVDVDEDTLWSPNRSRPKDHKEWIENDSGFPLEPRFFYVSIHDDGDSILSVQSVRLAFEALDTIRGTPGYNDVCLEGSDVEQLEDGTVRPTCRVSAVTSFWNDSLAEFEAQNYDDDTIRVALSARTYPDGTGVDIESIVGSPTYDDDGILTSAKLYLLQIDFPVTDEAAEFEIDALDNVFDLQDKWSADPDNRFKVEVFAERSFSDEFNRAILVDIPLVPLVFVVMSVFTCLIFFKRDAVLSQTTLGFGAVASVFLSITTGYGLLFTVGVPFTSMTQILPFVMFGIGMDAAYILSGSFHRTDPNTPMEERIEETVRDVGVSIALTTATSAAAFALGCISTIPAVYWLCLYAFPTIIIDFLYQMTFFIALMAIDGRRVQDNRRDCCCCIAGPSASSTVAEGPHIGENEDHPSALIEYTESVVDRFMVWYAHKLLQPWVKIAVIIVFLALGGGCTYSASLMTQEFDFIDVIPADSYVTPFWDSYNDYTDRGGFILEAYFRNVDQSLESVRDEMKQYINDIVGMDQVTTQPPFFWVADFDMFVADNTDLQGLPFQQQFDAFFGLEKYQKQYSEHIVIDEDNRIVTSRVSFYMDNINDSDVRELIDALLEQRDISESQPTNKGRKNWNFFVFGSTFLIWEFYSVAVRELILTTILGVFSVTALSLLFIPHWTAALFVFPLISLLYVDLLGILQFAGVRINAVSYIALVMSIGLLVDFLVHILLRYYELPGSRTTRVVEMLRTMGSSVLLGGISTFLGVIPLAFSTSSIFSTIFIAFIGLVLLGISHGLILLPVILSMCGPEMGSVHDVARTTESGVDESSTIHKQKDDSGKERAL